MELLAPAGNLEKLRYVYLYGADAAYAGFGGFSLRAKSDSFTVDQATEIAALKQGRKLYGAFNIFLYHSDFARLDAIKDDLAQLPFDAFIVSDPGAVLWFQRHFPQTPLHLSTQANCINPESARFWRDNGIQRIILGREASLADIEAIRQAVPEVELETFVHGAMCLAYSGRCFLSRWTCGENRSANRGGCTHSCRWEYRLLEEKARPGEYFPVEQYDGYTTILSSKDLNLIDHLARLRDVGVDSFKIEGRMKSLYYAALVVRAYRAAIDRLQGKNAPFAAEFREELWSVSHREYSTGFLFEDREIDVPHQSGYDQDTFFLATIGEKVGPQEWVIEVRNPLRPGQILEFLGPQQARFTDPQAIILNEERQSVVAADHMKAYTIQSSQPLTPGMIVRTQHP